MTENVTHYRAVSTQGALESVDFSTVGGENFAFFQLYDQAALESIRRAVTAPPLQQTVSAITSVAGKPMLITRGKASPDAILEEFKKSYGVKFEKVAQPKTFEAWRLRSLLGFGGQGLQLASSFLRPSGRIDTSVMVFAASNLAANTINLIYDHGTQVEDKHQLRYLKQQVNRELTPHLKAGESALSIDDKRTALRPPDHTHKPLDEAKGFLKRHSVAVGELGLRYLGAIGLAFPARWWKEAWMAKTLPRMDPSPLRVYTGLSSILGKTVAATSKIPDPYNPKPRRWFDDIREKYSFLTGGLIEVTSFSALAYDAFMNTGGKNSHRGIKINGHIHRDWLGGIGATMFVLGYIVRSWAQYGERKVDMNELYAHASDTLAETSPEKIPQLLANTSASLAEHFKNRPNLSFASIYSDLASDLHRYHAHTSPMHARTLAPTHTGVPANDDTPNSRVYTKDAVIAASGHSSPLIMR